MEGESNNGGKKNSDSSSSSPEKSKILEAGYSICMNCGNPASGRHNFAGVVVCSHCFSIASMCLRNAEKEVTHILSLFKEALRVQLASGRLKTGSTIPMQGLATRELPSRIDVSFLADIIRRMKK